MQLDAVFEPFQQTEGSTTGKYGGCGPGVLICEPPATLMEREIWAAAPVDIDRELHFMVWIENAEQKLSEGSDINGSEEKEPTGEIRPPLPQPEKIPQSVRLLIAEDHPVNQKLIKAMLTHAGYQVELVNNGKEAVESFCASSDHFDMILMDVQMPEMDGLAATKRIRAEGFDQIPIIALTAHAMEGDREICLAAGMNDYITKPIKNQTVIELIDHWVMKRNGS